MRLVPDMTAAGTLALLKDHLAKHGFGDIRSQYEWRLRSDTDLAGYEAHPGASRDLSQAGFGSRAVASIGWLLAGIHLHFRTSQSSRRTFGLGHGTGAHAPNEYYLVDSTNAKVAGIDGAVRSFVEYLYALA